MPADDEVGALALADLVADDRLDELAVLLVVGLEAAPVGELDPVSSIASTTSATENSRSVSTSTTTSGVPSSWASKPRSRDLPERHRQQPVGDVAVLGHALLQGYVEERLDHAAPAADQADGVAVAGPGGAPDDRPRLVLPICSMAARAVVVMPETLLMADPPETDASTRRPARKFRAGQPQEMVVRSWVARQKTLWSYTYLPA